MSEAETLRENFRKMLNALEPFVNFGDDNRHIVFPIGGGCTAEIRFSRTPNRAAIATLIETLRSLQDTFPENVDEVLTVTKVQTIVDRIFEHPLPSPPEDSQ